MPLVTQMFTVFSGQTSSTSQTVFSLHPKVELSLVAITCGQKLNIGDISSCQLLHWCQERVSNSTKEQRGRVRTRNNRQGDHQCKALVKGCRERTRARIHVSSQEKVHTNRNLARVTAKSRAGHRQL